MKLICPTCGSKDLWQPHTKTSFDRILETHGYGRYDCRNCWKRSIFKFDRKQFQREPPPREVLLSRRFNRKNALAVPIARSEESTVIGTKRADQRRNLQPRRHEPCAESWKGR